MSTKIFTLFGEEIVPDQQSPAPKTRAKKKDNNTDSTPQEAPLNAPTNIPDTQQPQPNTSTLIPDESAELQQPLVQHPIDEAPTSTPQPEPTEITTPQESITAVIEEAPDTNIHTTENLATDHHEEQEEQSHSASTADIIPEDWKGEKTYYGIGEVATFFNVKTSHIRFWTNEFKLKVRTNRKGDRLYTPDQVRELRAIYHLVKERGFTLQGAKTKLKTQNKKDVTTIDLKKTLQSLRAKLIKLRDQLN